MIEIPVKSQVSARPAPRQRRGIQRVQALLDAAEELLGEQGYEAATLNAIGERAGVPTASVYHYFADRDQVSMALLERYIEDVDQRVTTGLDDSELHTTSDAVDALIDPQLDYCRQHPSLVELWFTPGRSPMLVELELEWGARQAEQFWRFLIEKNLLGADTPLLVMELAFEAVDRLFAVAFRRSKSGDEATITEARRLLTTYLETYAP